MIKTGIFYFPHMTANSCTLDGILALSCTAPAKNVTPSSNSSDSTMAVSRLQRFICILPFRFFFFYYTRAFAGCMKKV